VLSCRVVRSQPNRGESDEKTTEARPRWPDWHVHTIDDEGAINRQFQIIPRTEGLYICQLYSWLDCGPTECKAISRDVILGDGVKLYATDELMNETSKKGYDRKRWDRLAQERAAS
jgi:hypothetical protein